MIVIEAKVRVLTMKDFKLGLSNLWLIFNIFLIVKFYERSK